MPMRRFATLIFAASLMCSVVAPVLAQNDSGTRQDMKNAGTDTKDAAKSTGAGVKQASKKSYHATRRTTVKATDKTKKAVDPKKQQ